MKKTNRKGFNFYRSYFDAYQLCESVEEKVEFMDALLNKQFLFQEPNLEDMSRMVKVIYMGQKHSIDKSVDGYCYKTNTPKEDPTKDTNEGSKEDPMVRYRSETPMTTEGSMEGSMEQEQLQEQLKEKEKLQIQEQLQKKLSFEEIMKKQHLITDYLK